MTQREDTVPASGWAHTVESDDYRMTLTSHPGERTCLAGEVRDIAGWRESCGGVTTLVDGLNLILDGVDPLGDVLAIYGTGTVDLPMHDPTVFPWRGQIEPLPGGWIGIDVTVDVQAVTVARPQLILWLGDTDLMNDRQAHTFRQTRLSSPTINSAGLRGNDLPAVYFYDPRLHVETLVYAPASRMLWTNRRFLDYRCDLRIDYGHHRYGTGLVTTEPAFELAPAKHRFSWYIRQRTLLFAPSDWEAQREMVMAVEQFIAPPALPAPSWERISAGTTADLLDPSTSHLEVEGHTGHTAYVRDTSEVREGDRRPDVLELMTQADVVAPLGLYLRLHPDPEAQAHYEKLLGTLPLFHRPERRWMANWFPARIDRPTEDIWYFLENALIKVPWAAAISGDDALWDVFLDALEGARDMARAVHYVFPLFVDIATRLPTQSATNYSVGGMYAYGQMLAHQRTGEERHLEEARLTLATLHRLAIDRMWHEPQQLGFAAGAAALLSHTTGDPTVEIWAEDFLSSQLRMAYWDDVSPNGDPLTGMFQACASLLYPAFKENVESILPWTHLLGAGCSQTGSLLRLLDAQRRNNGAYFDALRKGYMGATGGWIPHENLGTVELPQQGRLGKEIYGAGEVYWLYLLFEALGRSSDPEILVCSLDIPSLRTLAEFPPTTRSFVVFNGSTEARTTTLYFPALQPGEYEIRRSDCEPCMLQWGREMDGMIVALEAGDHARVDLLRRG